MAVEIVNGIFRLQIPLPRNPLQELNSYLIKGRPGGRSLLIDTGFHREECREALFSCLKELDVNMEETDIFLTHLHSDHTGLMPEIVTDRTTVYISPQDRNWIDGDYRFALEERENARFRRAGFAEEIIAHASETHPGRKFAPSPDFHRFTLVDERTVLQAGEYQIELIRVPGHTPGQMCLWIPKERILFTADHVLFDITPNITDWPDLPDALGCYLESLSKIDRYPARYVLPGHQETGDLHQRVQELLEHHRNRLEECRQVVADHPGSCACDIAGKMSWNIDVPTWEEFPPAQKWFAVGECLAHLERLTREGLVRESMDGQVASYRTV